MRKKVELEPTQVGHSDRQTDGKRVREHIHEQVVEKRAGARQVKREWLKNEWKRPSSINIKLKRERDKKKSVARTHGERPSGVNDFWPKTRADKETGLEQKCSKYL